MALLIYYASVSSIVLVMHFMFQCSDFRGLRRLRYAAIQYLPKNSKKGLQDDSQRGYIPYKMSTLYQSRGFAEFLGVHAGTFVSTFRRF